jgi:hypothetical protein
MRNPFHVLQVAPDASRSDLRAAQGFWTFVLDPDRYADRPELAPIARQIMKHVNAAIACVTAGDAIAPEAPITIYETLWIAPTTDAARVDRAVAFWRHALAPERFESSSLAKRAAEQLRKVENAFEDLRAARAEVVYVQGKRRYHRAGCTRLGAHCREVWLSEAVAQQMRPCRTCHPRAG